MGEGRQSETRLSPLLRLNAHVRRELAITYAGMVATWQIPIWIMTAISAVIVPVFLSYVLVLALSLCLRIYHLIS